MGGCKLFLGIRQILLQFNHLVTQLGGLLEVQVCGSLAHLLLQLEKQMRQAAADLNFEQAAELRDKMIELKKNLADAEK